MAPERAFVHVRHTAGGEDEERQRGCDDDAHDSSVNGERQAVKETNPRGAS
jgi:hypothetical protein